MRKQITVLLFLVLGLNAMSQTLNVEGVVKDAENGDMLPGVSIILKGSNTGTQTDFDGFYSLKNIDKGATLIFRYLGYKQKEVIVASEVVNVSMETEAESLSEIVVVGYGTQRKKEATGAVSVVDAKTIEKLNHIINVNCGRIFTNKFAVYLE